MRKADEEVVDLLPRSVEIAIGDVGDPEAVKAAVDGCNKIIYCATARSTITADLNRVDYQGVYNTTKAFQVVPLLYLSSTHISNFWKSILIFAISIMIIMVMSLGCFPNLFICVSYATCRFHE